MAVHGVSCEGTVTAASWAKGDPDVDAHGIVGRRMEIGPLPASYVHKQVRFFQTEGIDLDQLQANILPGETGVQQRMDHFGGPHAGENTQGLGDKS